MEASKMSDQWSRRKLLQTAALTGAGGVFGGVATQRLFTEQAGTRALFSDAESFPALVGGTSLDLQLAVETQFDGESRRYPSQPAAAFPSEFHRERALKLPFESVEPGDSGRVTFAYMVCETPADVSLQIRTDGDEPLAEALYARLWHTGSVSDGTSGGGENTVFEGPLSAFHSEPTVLSLADCIGCEPSGLGVRWTLREPETVDLRSTSLAVTFAFHARQCQQTDEGEQA